MSLAPAVKREYGGWTDEELLNALENSTRAMGRILPYLADRPGQRVRGRVLAELAYGKGASPLQLGGALGSFARRIKSRYGKDSWPFEAIHNKEKGVWQYRMDARTAAMIRSSRTSR